MVNDPWSVQPDILAPEDEDTPLPSSFSDVLHYVKVGHDEAVKEYLTLVHDGKHIHPEFVKETDIVKLLTDVGVKCFVPQNWEGIKGVEPLELTWKDTLPGKMKPKARHINPRLLEAAEKEFKRLKTYFYVDTNSDICSPLVIAPKATKPFIRFCGDYVGINHHIVSHTTCSI
jgi:hypothetical protein